MLSSAPRPFGLLSAQKSAQLLGLSTFQFYRLVADPPPGFPAPLPRRKGQRLMFSSVLLEAWLAGQDVSTQALPHREPSAPQVKRGPGRPRTQPPTGKC